MVGGLGVIIAGDQMPAVARVNGQEISWKALAEEVIARSGSEVLETMISRLLVEQACRERGIKISGQEIDEEIRRTADRMGSTPEAFLKLLKEKRGITPDQYTRDIVLPGLILKKMAKPYVKVAEEDIEKGFEAMYGEKMKCRWIMVNELPQATKIWNELRNSSKDAGGKIDVAEFERQVRLWSMDQETRTLGGQLQPISRHTSPTFQALEKAAFALKEDGEISNVVQFGGAWVILYRDGVVPPRDVKLEDVRKDIETQIYEAKMREQIEQVFISLQQTATIENFLTGQVISPDKTTVPAEHIEKVKQEPTKGTKNETPKKPAATKGK